MEIVDFFFLFNGLDEEGDITETLQSVPESLLVGREKSNDLLAFDKDEIIEMTLDKIIQMGLEIAVFLL